MQAREHSRTIRYRLTGTRRVEKRQGAPIGYAGPNRSGRDGAIAVAYAAREIDVVIGVEIAYFRRDRRHRPGRF